MEQFMLIVGFMFGVTLLYLLIAGLIGVLVYAVIKDTDNSVKLGLVFFFRHYYNGLTHYYE